MHSQNRSTSGGLLHPSPQSKIHYQNTQGRKRTAENALDEPTSLERSPRHPPPAQHAVPSNDAQPRKVPAPGATQAAIARLSALKAQGRGPSPPIVNQPAVGAAAAQQQHPKQKPKLAPGADSAPSGTKVPAPGATQAALARLGSKNVVSTNTGATNKGAPVSQQNPVEGPKKVPAPGATQAALARLGALRNAGGYPTLSPPPHPHFNGNTGAGAMSASARHSSSPPHPSAADFSHGTVVWAKMQSYPWWPAQVQHPNQDQMRLRHSSSDIFIVFYGTADYSWLPVSDLKLFRANLPEYSKFAATRNNSLQRAIDQAWVSVGHSRPDVMGKMIHGGSGGGSAMKPQAVVAHHHHQGW